jgi:AcrR family transcriptional regulator
MATADGVRPLRAAARRNYERIVTTAREAFSEHGADATLDDIAKRAEVGAGTLYRHFPTREALIEAVYRGEIAQLSEAAFRMLEKLPPGEALDEWMLDQVRYVVRKRGLAGALKASLDAGSETFAWCQSRMREAAAALLAPGQEAGEIRADITPADLLRLGHAIGLAVEKAPPGDDERLVSVMLAGLRR